ncbi:MAG: prolipoprotein diacylglyceryl transferase [Candidatus Hydrogenedentota bacterium]
MHPILFQIGSLNIHTYGLLVATGVFAGILIFHRECKKLGLSSNEITDFAVYIILASLVGARLFYVITDFNYYLKNPLEIIFSRSGFVFYGGFLAGALTAVGLTIFKKYPFWKVSDAVALALTLGHSIGRLGCFFQGCCYGKITTSPLGIRFPQGSTVADCLGVDPFSLLTPPVFPTQLFESAGLFLIFLILFFYKKYKSDFVPGFLILLYGIMYGSLRFCIEFLRFDFRGGYFYGLSISQWIAVFIIILATIMLFLRKK